MKINPDYINEYRRIMLNTNLQKGYQEFVKFFKELRKYLSENMLKYKFTGNIIENGMDYSYFQLSRDDLQPKGLKFVVAFIHNKFEYEIWLSGMNRKIQIEYHDKLSKIKHGYAMSPDPNRFDYILKDKLFSKIDYNDCEKLFDDAKDNILKFIDKVAKIL